MDATTLVGTLAEKGTVGLLLALSLYANLKQYQRNQELHAQTLAERGLRLEDKSKFTDVLLAMSDKVHQALDKVSDILERMGTGTRTPP